MPRHVHNEIKTLRRFVASQMFPTESRKRLGQGRINRCTGHQLNGCFDFFPKLLIGNAEDRNILHQGMGCQHPFDFRRIDINAARDNHVDLAVTQIQIPVFIEITDIAKGEDTRL